MKSLDIAVSYICTIPKLFEYFHMSCCLFDPFTTRICASSWTSSTRLKGRTTRLKGRTTRLKGRTTRLKGRTTRLKGRTTRLKGRTTRLKGRTTRLKGWTTRLKGRTTRLKGRTTRRKYFPCFWIGGGRSTRSSTPLMPTQP